MWTGRFHAFVGMRGEEWTDAENWRERRPRELEWDAQILLCQSVGFIICGARVVFGSVKSTEVLKWTGMPLFTSETPHFESAGHH